MKKFLIDLIKHTEGHDVPVINITSSEESTTFTGVTPDSKTYIYGKTHKPVDGLNGSFSFGNLSILHGIVKQPNFLEDKIKIQTKIENDVLREIIFKNIFGKNSEFAYRLSPITSKHPPQPNIKYDVVIKDPSSENIDELITVSNVMNKIDKKFTPMIDKDKSLIFNFGQYANHKAYVTFAENVEGQITNCKSWEVDRIIKVLKLSNNATCDVKINTNGMFTVSIDNGYSIYDYLFPGVNS